jgi:GNAT superfamily N-acetyltransferase
LTYGFLRIEATMHTIRSAAPGDAAVLADYNRRMALETEGRTLDSDTVTRGVAACLADPHKGRYFVAEADGIVAGQLLITREWSDWRNAWIWWIQSVYVHPDHRRHGLFTALFEHVRHAALSEGDVIAVRLYVEKDNSAAQAVYDRLGFAATDYLLLERQPL